MSAVDAMNRLLRGLPAEADPAEQQATEDGKPMTAREWFDHVVLRRPKRTKTTMTKGR